MEKGEKIKKLGIAIQMLGLAFMFISYVKTADHHYPIMIGLIIVSVGTFISAYGGKQLSKDEAEE